MWKPEHRIAADRIGLRYPSDLTGAEWAIVEPMVPPAKQGGRKRTIDVREILSGIFYVPWTGCQWQALPKDLPLKSTVWAHFDLWTWDGTLERIHHALYVAVREQAGREASPTTAITDCQSAKGAQKGGLLDPQGFDAGKKITGRKRHILVDTLGLLLSVAVHPANIQDRDGVPLVLDRRTRRLFPFIERIYSDGGYQGPKAAKAVGKTVAGQSRSSSARSPPSDSNSSPSAGSSNAPLPGSAASGAWHAISSATPEPSPPSSTSP